MFEKLWKKKAVDEVMSEIGDGKDDVIRTEDDLKNATFGLPVLGSTPDVPNIREILKEAYRQDREGE